MKYSFNDFTEKEKIKLAGIVADLMGDGHLQNPPKNRFDYTSKSIDELKRFESEIYNLFKIKGKIRRCTTNKYKTYNYGVNNKKTALFLNSIGVPRGNKVLNKFLIPEWIMKDKLKFARFINRLFCCEAHVDINYPSIDIRMYKSSKLINDGIEFFNQIKNGLDKHYRIISTNPFLSGNNIRKDGVHTYGIRLKIKRKDSLKKYKEFINLENKEKSNQLNKIIN